jgi:predicted GNAT family acetyltransferase
LLWPGSPTGDSATVSIQTVAAHGHGRDALTRDLDSIVMLGLVSGQVRDNPAESRYEVFSDGELAGFAQYVLRGDRITMFHTEVDPAFEGEGLGGELAREALDDVGSRGLTVEPLCPFIASFIRHHADAYLDLVVPEMREKVTRHAHR